MQRGITVAWKGRPQGGISRLCRRWYQSEGGVHGYRRKERKSFSVPDEVLHARNRHSNVYRWVEAYRSHGHNVAQVNPVDFSNRLQTIPELEFSRYGLSEAQKVETQGIISGLNGSATVKELENALKKIYCGTVSAEINHIGCEQKKEWLKENFERIRCKSLPNSEKREIAELMIKSQAWDNFLATKFPTVKRYGGEGAETMMAFFRQILKLSAQEDIKTIVLGMPHRGRLNLLTTMLKTRPAKVFRKFKGQPEFPAEAKAMCDIASHFHVTEDLSVDGKTIHFCMLHNPSHLEAVNPVSMGKTRSQQQSLKDGAFGEDEAKDFSSAALNIQLHGDAAFPGQGVNQECLFMTGTPHFDIGGTIHMVVNNQVGFTTPGDRGRSSNYCTDLAKSIDAPVFHVNVDDPEALALITELAFEYQREFRSDVFIDLNCFRRWGHNEVDDPTFTNPALYQIIHNRKSVPDKYTDFLVSENEMTQEEVNKIAKDHTNFLASELSNLDSYEPEKWYFRKQWSGMKQAGSEVTVWDTGLDYSLLGFIGVKSVTYPENFAIHQHLEKTHVAGRIKKIKEGRIDWATAEAMALGSLMYQGHNIRLSGEDVGRGTFSHRHAMLVDQKTNEIHIPLNSMEGGLGGKLEIANSILSEEAVLGFEYGMAIDNPYNLIIWEAQFGDFFNGAQILFDTFICSGETKWMISNGLVVLLPHGFDGAASEHSSCRLERFLQMTDSSESQPDGDDVNFQIINPTTPAQYFHALRRQIVRDFRKPLIMVAPKVLLRLSDATSAPEDFKPGTHFLPVIGDSTVNPSDVKKVILCTGKHYYNLKAERKNRGLGDVAIVRVESLCPFPVHELNNELDKYKSAKTFIWSQEEHRNMGAWTFVKPRFENLLARRIKYSGRYVGGTVAVGVSSWHQQETQFILTDPFDMK
ncbi:probable 2-oxoglutarate dehydrogenase E1 component DHKTD1 homolog, mitochondrial [Phlebotomus argentipes]|uniref:probable 2-oxoglutarate dehydrogenase E1 component DHKTD1 homolog, mitochondrial n=1 Tax=Phlebotomus argentipes TaxID=94469 RepID=UPI0028937982|nr:probable 2-oxoglutarate dehydrogenase E1 component DHKTD1 homolog, mitochondrial [Phlebotomus argentipes]